MRQDPVTGPALCPRLETVQNRGAVTHTLRIFPHEERGSGSRSGQEGEHVEEISYCP